MFEAANALLAKIRAAAERPNVLLLPAPVYPDVFACGVPWSR